MEKIMNLLERLVSAVEKLAEAGSFSTASVPLIAGAVHPFVTTTTSGAPEIPADLSALTIEALRQLADKLEPGKDFPKGTRSNTIVSWIETKRKALEEPTVIEPDPLTSTVAEAASEPAQTAAPVFGSPDPLGGFDALSDIPGLVEEGPKVYLAKDVTATLLAWVKQSVKVPMDHVDYKIKFKEIIDNHLMPLLARHGLSSAQSLPEDKAQAIMNDAIAGKVLQNIHLNCVEAMVK